MSVATPAPIHTLLVRPGFTILLRLALVTPFLQSGLGKGANLPVATSEVAGFGLPAPFLVALAVVATQLVGSVLFLTRRWCWLGAGMLAVFTVFATLLAHAFWQFDGIERAHQMATFFEHIAIIGGLTAGAVLVENKVRP